MGLEKMIFEVEQDKRDNFMPRVFKKYHISILQNINKLAAEYIEGFEPEEWKYYTFGKKDGKKGFLALDKDKTYKLKNRAGYECEFDGIMAGIALTSQAMVMESFDERVEFICKKYDKLESLVVDSDLKQELKSDFVRLTDEL